MNNRTATGRPRVLTADFSGIQSAAHTLRNSGLVAFPTETVYGLGGDATSDIAVAAIFDAKGRPSFNPLIVHFPDAQAAWSHVTTSQAAKKLAKAFWPGPLTLVLPRQVNSTLSLLVSAGLDSVAVRVPANATARELLMATGTPVAAPSANRSGGISPTNAAHVSDSLGDRIDAIVDGGSCDIGIESTVVALMGDRGVLLRPGSITRTEIETVIGPVDTVAPDDETTAQRSPGMLKRHYAPNTPVRLNAMRANANEVLLGFGSKAPKDCLNLSKKGDTREAAVNLFAMLRQLDCLGADHIAVMPIPDDGLGTAINDRLRRAAES